ncbi:MAG: FAD-dependent oxidoreductase, partial [Hungatella sp.]
MMSKNQNCDYDVVIIGGGVIGCAVARELSRYQLSICLVEKEEDVCAGTSKANSAIIHAGHDAVPGSLKARFNIEGNRMMEQLALDLDFDFKRNGSLVLCLTKEELPALQSLYEKGIQNGVPGLTMISGEEAKNMESNLSESVVAALYAPTGGIVCPFGLTIALAENACDNGVEFR